MIIDPTGNLTYLEELVLGQRAQIERLKQVVAKLATEIEFRDNPTHGMFPRQSIEEWVEMTLYPEHFHGGIGNARQAVAAGICPDCDGPIAIRNPTGHCDHLRYPEYKKTLSDVDPLPI